VTAVDEPFDMAAWHDRHVAAARTEARTTPGRRREGWRLHTPTVAQMRAELADIPLHPDTVAAGLWQDAESERLDSYDPDDRPPHPGGAYWERLIEGEAWL
jgi:hypothetical protein